MIVVIFLLLLNCFNKSMNNLKEIFTKLLKEYIEAKKVDNLELKQEMKVKLISIINKYSPEGVSRYFILKRFNML